MMMLSGFVLGFGFGWMRAARRGGNRLDKLQYGAAHGIAIGIAALFIGIVIARVTGA